MTGMPAGSNDSRTFAADTKIPTVAIEPPIRNMHQAVETTSRQDVEYLRDFLKAYLTTR